MKRLFVIASVLAIAVLAFPTTVMAGGMLDGRVVLGGNFTLNSGETLDGDLLVLGGNVTLQVDSRVAGDVNVLGGNVNSDGTIDGDVNIIGGNVRLQDHALVRGDIRTVGGSLFRSQGATVEGQYFSENEFNFPFNFDWSGDFSSFSFGRASVTTRILWFLFRTVMLAALAVLLVMFIPKPTTRVAETLVQQPIISGGLGLLTLVLAPAVFVIFTITLVLIPAVFLAVIVLLLAVLWGWIAIGLEVGNRLAEMLNWDPHPAAAAGVGTLLFSGVIGGIGFIPCFGWMVVFLAGVVAMGAVLLSRFGTRAYTLAGSQASMPAAELEAEEPKAEEKPAKKGSSKKK